MRSTMVLNFKERNLAHTAACMHVNGILIVAAAAAYDSIAVVVVVVRLNSF